MKDLEQKRRDLLKEFEIHRNFLRGSITGVCATCNRANCICERKSSRKAYRLTYKNSLQKTKTVYIARNQLGEVRKMIANYKRIREIAEQLIDINVELFKQNAREARE